MLGQEFSYGKLPSAAAFSSPFPTKPLSAAAFFTVPKQKCFDHTDTEGGFAKQNFERAVPQSGIRRRNTQIPKTQHDKTVVITLKICTEIQEGVPLLIISIRHDIIWKIYIFFVGNVELFVGYFSKINKLLHFYEGVSAFDTRGYRRKTYFFAITQVEMR